MVSNNRIIINVGGVRHELYESTLKSIPSTRLSELDETLGNYDPHLKEYFFDRHPGVFAQVLNYYRTGKLHYPLDVCVPLFEVELEFWKIDSNVAESCCWATYSLFCECKHKERREVMNILEQQEPNNSGKRTERELTSFENDRVSTNSTSWKQMQTKIWSLFDEQYSSFSAKVIGVISAFFICASIMSLSLKNNPDMQVPEIRNITITTARNTTTWTLDKVGTRPLSVFFYIDCVCIGWFTFEILIRFISAPTKWVFIRSFVNIIDFVATLSFYVDVALQKISDHGETSTILEFLSVIRIIRLFKLTKFSSGLKIIILALRTSAKQLILIGFLLLLGTLNFTVLIHFAERIQAESNNPRHSNDMMSYNWWSLLTFTGVGNGDKNILPKTYLGMCLGALCAAAGVVAVALPIPIITYNFIKYYSATQRAVILCVTLFYRYNQEFQNHAEIWSQWEHRDQFEVWPSTLEHLGRF